MNYDLMLRQAETLARDEDNTLGLMANIAALIKEHSGWHWVGFYLVHDNELWLGPFQGPVACSKIGYDKGVCGKAWASRRPVIVPDVDKFEGHIACSSLSRSEIVIPLFRGDTVVGVLDIDSCDYDAFTDEDLRALQKICSFINL